MTHRQRTIQTLLERYQELVEPTQTARGTGDGYPRPPGTYTTSVRELERLLRQMRDDRAQPLIALASGTKVSVRACWWHLNARYIASTTTIKSRTMTRKTRHHKRVTTTERQLVVSPNGSTPAIVDAGIGWLADHWRLPHEPMLPRELQVSA